MSTDLKQSLLLQGTTDQLDDLLNSYNHELTKLLDDHAPLKPKVITDRENSQWFTGELGTLKKEACALQRKHKETGFTVNLDIYHKKCHEYEIL